MTWQRRNRTIALQTPWLRVFRDEYTLPNGTEVDDFYVIERNDFVLVVAEQNDHVALVRQYRPATNRYYYSLPGGYLGSVTGRSGPISAALADKAPMPDIDPKATFAKGSFEVSKIETFASKDAN